MIYLDLDWFGVDLSMIKNCVELWLFKIKDMTLSIIIRLMVDIWNFVNCLGLKYIYDSVLYSSYLNKLVTKNRYRAINPFITWLKI